MKYYSIELSADPKVIGKNYPQTSCTTLAQAHLINSWKLFNPQPNLGFELNKSAVLTDFLSTSAVSSKGFLVGQTVKELLADFKLMQHQFFNAPVSEKKNTHPYFWLHLSEPSLSRLLDYEKSVFFRTEYTFREEEIQLKSYDHYDQLKKEDKDASFGVELDSIVLGSEFDRTLDIFTFLPFATGIFISERLATALKESGLSGIEIKEAPIS